MKIVSYNVNGIRAALRKGLLVWLKAVDPDIFCLQEVKASADQVDLDAFRDLGFHHIYWFPADKKGYSGTAALSRYEPLRATMGCGAPAYDSEGRVITLNYPGLTLMNVYFPSGSSGESRQSFKYQWLADFYDFIKRLRQQHPDLVICGDMNICHQPIDIHNPVANKKSSGFLPSEREWFTSFLDSGFVDTFRHFNQEPHHYTWWSNIFNSRAKNRGWRIDYFLASAQLKDQLIRSVILKDAIHSDHCPVLLEIDVERYREGENFIYKTRQRYQAYD